MIYFGHYVFSINSKSWTGIRKFDDLLQEKLKKFNKKYGIEYLIYTSAHCSETHIRSISIPHPFDKFNSKIGEAIVKGRIKRAKGEIHNRAAYGEEENNIIDGIICGKRIVPIPPYIDYPEE